MIADSLSFANCDDLDHEVLLVTCPEYIYLYIVDQIARLATVKNIYLTVFNIIMNIIFNYFQTF